MFRIGHSKDTHRFVEGRPLILGGVKIDYKYGLLGHSDADVVLHAVAESLIGALGLGDLGTHFPDNDPSFKNKESSFFVSEALKMVNVHHYNICNIDITVYLEEPHLKDYKPLMKENIARLLNVTSNKVNVKATRGEGLGFIGRKEGICSEAIVLLEKQAFHKKL